MSAEEAAPSPGVISLARKAMARSVDETPLKKPPIVSSVFITPPASMERKKAPDLPHLPEPAPKISPPFFPTPGATPTSPSPPTSLSRLPPPLLLPKLSLEKGEDIVSGLFSGGYRLLTEQILDYLDPSDLYNSTLVCNCWTKLLTSFPHLRTKIRTYTKDLHKNSENFEKPFPALALATDRKPLGDAKNRLLAKNGQGSTPSLKSAVAIPKRVMYKHRHCPQCRSASKQLNLRRAECTNSKCRFDFCSSCFKSWHEGECERQRSPKRPSKELTAGSKRSKKNLKRL